MWSAEPSKRLGDLGILKIFRYVDYFLVISDRSVFEPVVSSRIECQDVTNPVVVARILASFSHCFKPLSFTTEFPVQHNTRFLDLRLHFKDEHVCRVYDPRANKPPLKYSSAKPKLIKRNIMLSFFVKRSLQVMRSLGGWKPSKASGTFRGSGHVIVSVAEGLHRKRKSASRFSEEQRAEVENHKGK